MHINKDHLTMGQRVGEVISVACMLVVIAFFSHHLTLGTGFFTTAFGPWEQLCLFVPLVASLAAPMTHAVVGWRNPARPFEIATDLLLVIGSFWLLRVFPFDFTHLADALPSALRFLLAWVPDWLGRAVLALQVALGLIMAVVTTWQFAAGRGTE
jgi:hypothetical protein